MIRIAGADVRDDRDRSEGDERDDPRPGGKPIETVGEIDAVCGSGDDKEEQHVPAVRQLHVPVHDRDEHGRRQMLVVGCEPDADGDQRQQDQLPPAAQAERPAVGQLDEVVEETDRAAAERDEQHRQRRHLVLRHREEGDRRDDEDQQPAHRRRPLLDLVSLGALFANVLPELVATEEVDELRTDDDRDDHGDHPGDENSDHAAGTRLSAAATASRPTAREALTSTASPGRTTSSSARTASCTFATQRPGTPASR